MSRTGVVFAVCYFSSLFPLPLCTQIIVASVQRVCYHQCEEYNSVVFLMHSDLELLKGNCSGSKVWIYEDKLCPSE